MLQPSRPVFLKSAWVKPQTGHFCEGAPFSISSAAPMPRSKSASANPVGSCTPFSFEQASHRFTFCILPSRICVKKTVASLHLQTSHNISVRLDLETPETFNPGHLRAPSAPTAHPLRVKQRLECPLCGLVRGSG